MKVTIINAADVSAPVQGRWGKLLLRMEKDDKIVVNHCTAADINAIRTAASYLTNRKNLPMVWRTWSSRVNQNIMITRIL